MNKPEPIEKLKAYYKKQDKSRCLRIWLGSHDLLQIIFIRHGEPDLTYQGWFNNKRAEAYSKEYDQAGIKEFDNSPLCTDNLQGVKVYHSTLPRAVHTAKLIFGEGHPMEADVRFREFEKKLVPLFDVDLPLKLRTGLSRLLWYAGLNSHGIENVAAAKLRTRRNADFLAAEAGRYGVVVLVAHGFHNHFVSKYLRVKGWRMVRNGGTGHLSINILAKPK